MTIIIQGYLFYHSSGDIMASKKLRTQKLLTKFYLAWSNLPLPPPKKNCFGYNPEHFSVSDGKKALLGWGVHLLDRFSNNLFLHNIYAGYLHRMPGIYSIHHYIYQNMHYTINERDVYVEVQKKYKIKIILKRLTELIEHE